MTAQEISKIMPLIIVLATPLILMLVIAFRRNHFTTMLLSVVGLAAALAFIPASRLIGIDRVGELLVVDSYALFYYSLIFLATIFIVVSSYSYLQLRFSGNKEEYYLLILTAALGSAILASAVHFVSFFLGLEILSVSLYGLVAYLRHTNEGIEAALKYLILAAVSSAFLVFGMALIYSQVGSMAFSDVMGFLSAPGHLTVITIGGLALMIVGFGFKLAVVPFHMWSPDVYEGAPAPVTAFIASVSKGGILALLFRLFSHYNLAQSPALFLIFAVLAVLSMFGGNFLALMQKNVKRLLAYSSIAHFGYILVAFLAGNGMSNFRGIEAATFYLVSYFVTIIGAFIIVGVLSTKEKEAQDMGDYRGLYWRHPFLSVALSAMLFSLAGIPLTAGFVGKYYVLSTGVGSHLWWLVIVLIVNSAIGVYYYLRLIVEMFSQADMVTTATKPNVGVLTGVVLAFLTIALVWLGVYPTGIIAAIKASSLVF